MCCYNSLARFRCEGGGEKHLERWKSLCWHFLLNEAYRKNRKKCLPGWGSVAFAQFTKEKAFLLGSICTWCWLNIHIPHILAVSLLFHVVMPLVFIQRCDMAAQVSGLLTDKLIQCLLQPVTAKAPKTIPITSKRRDHLLMCIKRTKTDKYESPLCNSRGVHVWKGSSVGHTGDANSSSRCG